MRPGQNKRMRGRPTNNRRGPNPLTRSYESNGPGRQNTPATPIMSRKNISSSRETLTQAATRSRRKIICNTRNITTDLSLPRRQHRRWRESGQQRPPGEGEGDDLEDDGDFGGLSDRFASPAERQNATRSSRKGKDFSRIPSVAPNAPQPFVDRPSYEPDRQGGNDRGELCAAAGSSGQPISG